MNELLASIIYTPSENFHGRDVIEFLEQRDKKTRSLMSISTRVQPVNDLTSLTLENPAINTLEDTEILIGGVQLSDPDSDFVRVNLTCNHGIVSFSFRASFGSLCCWRGYR